MIRIIVLGRLYWGLATYGSYHVKMLPNNGESNGQDNGKLKLGLHSRV